jgi:hypothetical protein
MKSHLNLISLAIILFLILSGCAAKEVVKEKETPKEAVTVFDKAEQFITSVKNKELSIPMPRGTLIDTIIIDTDMLKLDIYLTKEFSYIPFREDNVRNVYSVIESYFKEDFGEYKIAIYSLNQPIEQLIPNYYRKDTSKYDYSRIPKVKERPLPVVRNISKPFEINKGLYERNILLWHSHGWYYNNTEGRWEWQRPRLFQTVEDLIPMSFTIPYLIPMLENAGANVFVPRERDTQINEVIVDNDSHGDIKQNSYSEKTYKKNLSWQQVSGKGFALGTPPYANNLNPFEQGTYRFITSDSVKTAEAVWIPDIPAEGYYAVYVSYSSDENNVTDADYSVHHSGGITRFKVNQQIGGGTWIYLGKFKFNKGKNDDKGKVVLSNHSTQTEKIVTADAVRFGGGMGVIERDSSTSGRAKYLEGARYWLQFAGMPDTLIYSLNKNQNDYRDDYQCRAEYGNYLYGTPFGPNKDRDTKGLGIPIDLSLAFHTDAGITRNDTTVGTLSIYSIEDFNGSDKFPDSTSRLANRDLADLMQTQLVEDLRAKYDIAWNRRDLRNADYSEAVRPNFPSVLLELLSHQNFLDMKFVLDPRFKFDAARAIYKSMLRFLSVQYNFDYVVQPLPVTHFSAVLNEKGEVVLRWKPSEDPLEPSAKPDRYIVYTRIEEGGFDNGFVVEEPEAIIQNIKEDIIYSFKITAVNDGGESFPSEILSVCKGKDKNKLALIINGFDRVSGPESIDAGAFSGFLNIIDAGVPDKYDLGFTGIQRDFNSFSQFRTNDSPGHGASSANFETQIIAGNTFDFPFIHGLALKENGFSFVSTSDEAVEDRMINLTDYKFVDLILGEEKETSWQKPYADSINGKCFQAFSLSLQDEIRKYFEAGGNLFVSGAYVATDLFKTDKGDSTNIKFAQDVLKINWGTNHAAVTGKVFFNSNNFGEKGSSFTFNTELNEEMYAVEAPDAIQPINGSETILRYNENNFSAAAGYKGDYNVIVFGFPFETILTKQMRIEVMKEVLRYFSLIN